ncbi:MAG: type II toxin-antitoxin system HicB family antitoxin [Prevotellaceae bacterium]|jgi:predicted RNase H-like HicB family nuclease|nr:type II toxin-antitoxin system HicB family antitoxin [Prevotellaceae bacterium]
MKYTAIIEKISDDCYIASCAEIKGANTQGATIKEAMANLSEAIQLVMSTEKIIAVLCWFVIQNRIYHPAIFQGYE